MASPFVSLSPTLAMVPVLHGRLAFAREVRRAMVAWQPTMVALEWPRALGPQLLDLLADLPRVRLLAWHIDDHADALFIPADPCDPVVEAVRLAREHQIDVSFVDVDTAAWDIPLGPFPDVDTAGVIGAAAYAGAWETAAGSTAAATPRERIIAGRLARLAASHRVLHVGDLRTLPKLRQLLGDDAAARALPDDESPAPDALIVPVEEELVGMAIGEFPRLAYLYECFRGDAAPEDEFPLAEALADILHTAEEQYTEEFDERINLTEWRALYQFGRNLSLEREHLRPHLYELVTAAKGCVDHQFGAITFEVAATYPPNRAEGTPDFSPRRSLDIYVDAGRGVSKARPAYPGPDLAWLKFQFDRRPPSVKQRQRWKRRWQEDFSLTGGGICSWPPEDDKIEEFFRYLRQRALQSLTDDHLTVEPFQTSVLDGLDVRETIRRWHEKKLYVRRERQPPGKIGPVVLIWRDAPLDDEGLWRSTLYAEHAGESDIAIYTSPPGEHMVGPDITRAEYHGILSVFPAVGIPDLWSLPMMDHFGTCARVLLGGALLLSEERYVAYVADTPPDASMKALARRLKVGIVYLPLASFSRKTLKRLRQFHLLASRQAREWGGDYIV